MLANMKGVRGYATSKNMEQLMQKLSNLSNAAPAAIKKEANPAAAKSGKKHHQSHNNADKKYQRRNNGKSGKQFNGKSRNDKFDQPQRRNGRSSQREGPRTVSQYDRFRNPANKKKSQSLNAKGDGFAVESELKASYIKRKVNAKADFLLTSKHTIVNEFASSLLKHEPQYSLKADPFKNFKSFNGYELEQVNQAELELSKDKLGYDTKSRVLRALEQITTKRGFKLVDGVKSGFQYLPYNAQLYPFANTTLPANLMRNHVKLDQLKFVPETELQHTLATVVLGQRPELKFDSKAEYKTAQLRVNAQVVANSLNNNAQLQVDELNTVISPVLIGQKPIKTLPQAILAPKKI